LRALERDSQQFGTQGGRLDFALLLDGLLAERQQGITIDVAYRFFATDRRQFIVADAPGHEQYTRNMATGASTADLAVILVDARKGVLTQTRRHTRIVAMMGIRHVVMAVNKMDLVGYARETFQTIVDDYEPFATECGVTTIRSIPISALHGENLISPSLRMPWYSGPTVMAYLETVDAGMASAGPFRMPVQWVSRPNQDFRGFCGRVSAGTVRKGDRVRAMPSGMESRVKAIVAYEGNRECAMAGESTTITLEDQLDVSRGDVIAAASEPPPVADQFQANLLWLSARELIPERQYLLKMHSKEMTASVMEIRFRLDVDTSAHLAAKTLAFNEIGVVTLSTLEPLVFEPYQASRTLGGFILIEFALRRASNIHWQALEVDRQARTALKQQRSLCVWFTGLSGSGKSSIANLLEKRLYAAGHHTYLLDGDNIRHGLNRDLGFTEADRAENVRRVAEVARLMVDAGLIVLVSFISPFRAERRLARSLFGDAEFIEVFVDTPLAACERRDPKGLYAKARSGLLPNFTGIDSPYEPPESPEAHLLTSGRSIEDCVDQVFAMIT
jgi:bifunctional enzyme CysN/CysC